LTPSQNADILFKTSSVGLMRGFRNIDNFIAMIYLESANLSFALTLEFSKTFILY